MKLYEDYIDIEQQCYTIVHRLNYEKNLCAKGKTKIGKR